MPVLLQAQTPHVPDGNTALFGLGLLAAAFGALWLWRRLRHEKTSRSREVLLGLVIASFICSANFWLTDVVPRLVTETLDFSREPDPSGAEHAFGSFLRDVDRLLPDGDSVLLMNCQSAVATDQANYALYPRRVLLRRLSMAPIGDPRRELSARRLAELRAAGADWVLDLDPPVWRNGAAQALVSLEAPR